MAFQKWERQPPNTIVLRNRQRPRSKRCTEYQERIVPRGLEEGFVCNYLERDTGFGDTLPTTSVSVHD